MGRKVRWAGILCAVIAVAGCEDKSKPMPPTTSATAASVTVSASASAPASSSAEAPDPSKATRWAGTYESKHVKVETPDKVKDYTWKNDDGTKAVGKGQLSLQMAGTVVRGEATGPLGPQKVSGVMDDSTLRISLVPSDPASSLAMAGSGVGELKGGKIVGTLRCAGPKGVVVREVSFELEPAK